MSTRQVRRREFIKTVGAAVVAPAVLRNAWGATTATRKPNVLMIVADDQRHDTIAALGNAHVRTPTLDRLATEGFAFTRARCMGSQQGAVCVPSR
ncbi:MAG TPA: sulfatase-like hydrolase/transferase, partial [Tepidisphaeraceae bacterium]|nr:sulfatase-like hydrolase/transferase [Tepidisphaeraceae bacterium]